jgi:hypothetical protein
LNSHASLRFFERTHNNKRLAGGNDEDARADAEQEESDPGGKSGLDCGGCGDTCDDDAERQRLARSTLFDHLEVAMLWFVAAGDL